MADPTNNARLIETLPTTISASEGPVKQYLFSPEALTQLAYEIGGAATAPLLADNPSYEFPSTDVAHAIRSLLREKGIEPAY